MSRFVSRLLTALGVDPRGFFALTKHFLLIDLRGQHYARATAIGPGQVFTPVFLVVGIYLTVSAAASLVLFARVDVFFFAFVNLSLSMLAIAAAVLVEFNEVALNPSDLEIVSHRPVAPRTYAAARFANLLFYFLLMYVALNLFPLVVGAGLRDAGPWYVPAYLLASLAGNLAAVCLVILLLSLPGLTGRWEHLKDIFAWTQTALLLVVGYGAQLVLRDTSSSFLLWGAFPPAWVGYTPAAWLARFVEAAADRPGIDVLWLALLLIAILVAVCGLTVGRLSRLYAAMQPVAVSRRRRPMPRERVGGLQGTLAGWFARNAEERVGFWLSGKLLAREQGLKMRCLWPLNLAVAVVVLGLATGQFANPLRETRLGLVTLPILSVYFLALAVPALVYGLTFCRDAEAGRVLLAAPLPRPADVGRGLVKAVLVCVVTPLCLLWFAVAWAAWQDPAAAGLHAALAWMLSWLLALAALGFVVPAAPFSLPPARGGSVGPVNLPMAFLFLIVLALSALHYFLAASPFFWAGVGLAALAVWLPLEHRAATRFARLWGAQP
jgi:hypothetical protein